MGCFVLGWVGVKLFVFRIRGDEIDTDIKKMCYLRSVTTETRCVLKKLEFQRSPLKYIWTAQYEHKSSKKKVLNFSKTVRLKSPPVGFSKHTPPVGNLRRSYPTSDISAPKPR